MNKALLLATAALFSMENSQANVATTNFSPCCHLNECCNPSPTGLELRASSGDREAQYQLGMKYAEAAGGLFSDGCLCREANEWFRRAAVQGHEGAAKMIGHNR